MEDMRGTVTVNSMCSLGRNGSLMDGWLVRTHCIERRRIHIHHSILAHSEYRDEEEDTHMS